MDIMVVSFLSSFNVKIIVSHIQLNGGKT